MKVRIYVVEGGYVVAGDGGRGPGTYPTKQEAARAAWLIRWHRTPGRGRAPFPNPLDPDAWEDQ